MDEIDNVIAEIEDDAILRASVGIQLDDETRKLIEDEFDNPRLDFSRK